MGRFINKGRDLVRASVRSTPTVKRALKRAEDDVEMWRHELARRMPSLIKPRTRKMTVAITAQCNLRCVGCRYGRDFMPGHQLSLEMVEGLLEDGRAAGVETVRLYGGEPLLHKDLPAMVRKGVELGLRVYVTTNGVLLERKIDELHEAGLRDITIGYYGTGARYDAYVQRPERYAELQRGVRAVRDRYGDEISLQLNYLVMRPSRDLDALERAWEFALEHDMTFHTDLVHYSLPYFTEGLDHDIQLLPEHLPEVRAITERLLELKAEHPERIPESAMSLRSIPDWLEKGPEMDIPCDVYKMIWVGADGSVKLCYVTFDLGNLHENRLSEILYTDTHEKAAQDAFALNCPGCHCERDARIRKDRSSRAIYGAAKRDSRSA